MVKVMTNKKSSEDIKLEKGAFRAEFNVNDGEIGGIGIHFYDGANEKACNLYAIEAESIDALFDLVSQLRAEIKKRGFDTKSAALDNAEASDE